MAAPTPILQVYPLSNYTFGTKPPKFDKDPSNSGRMERLKDKYAKEGVRRSVDAVLIVHEHGHPHILLIQIGSMFFKMPGGRLRPGEQEHECLLRKMDTLLAPEAENMKPDWQIGDCVGTFYRPSFDTLVYPYCPAHIERPKEIRRQFVVNLPEKAFLAIPKNMRLIAVPLFEIYDHAQRYGPIIAAVPQLLSRYQLVLSSGDAGGGGGEEKMEEERGRRGEKKQNGRGNNDNGTLAIDFDDE